MSIRIVTGRTGMPHVTSYQMQSMYRGLFGDIALLDVGDCFSATKLSNNLVQINSGVILFQGVYAIIPYGDTDEVAIENVEPGYKRIDTICVQYTRDVNTDTESVQMMVVKGETVEETPAPPEITSGDRWEYGVDIKVPMYDVLVTLDGITITPRDIMNNPYPTIAEVFQSVSNGKIAIASAITDKGVSTDASATFAQMAQNIERIPDPGAIIRDLYADSYSYQEATADFFDKYEITENTTPQDIADVLGMSLRERNSKLELYKDASDIKTRYELTMNEGSIDLRLYRNNTTAQLIQGITELYYYKTYEYCLWGNSDTRICFGWMLGNDIAGNDVYMYFNADGSTVDVDCKGYGNSYNSSKVYQWSNTINVFRKIYIINSSDVECFTSANGFLTEVYKQNQTETFVITLGNGERFISTNKLANSAGMVFRLNRVGGAN